MSSKLRNKKEIQDIASGFQKSRILLSAFELNIFSVIEGNSYNAKEISEKINCSLRGTTKLLDALVAIGILHKAGTSYFNTELGSRYLVKGKDEYMAGLGHTSDTWNMWHNLTDAVKSGTMVNYSEINERGPEWLEYFIGAMHSRGVYQASIFSNILDFNGVNKILDLGGGSGAFLNSFLDKAKEAKGVLFDLPNVIPISKKFVEKSANSNRIEFVEGSFETDDIGSGYDFIFLSAIIHMLSYEANKSLIIKCADALNENGKIVISDYIVSEDRTRPERGALFAINMLVDTSEGDTYTEQEVNEWAENAGLTLQNSINTPFQSSLITLKK